jgi:hypothetical protein
MDETQWKRLECYLRFITTIEYFRLMSIDQTDANLIEPLKRRQTFIKFKANGHTYSRIYYLTSSDDAIHYLGSRYRSKYEACMII